MKLTTPPEALKTFEVLFAADKSVSEGGRPVNFSKLHD